MASRKIDPVRATQGKALAQLRAEHGLGQADVAATCGISKSAVSEWETGKSTPRIEHLGAIHRLFGRDSRVLAIYGIDVDSGAVSPPVAPDDPTVESLSRDLAIVRGLLDDLHDQWTGFVRDQVADRRRRDDAVRP